MYEEHVWTPSIQCTVFCGCGLETKPSAWIIIELIVQLFTITHVIHRPLCQNWGSIMWNILHESKTHLIMCQAQRQKYVHNSLQFDYEEVLRIKN